MLFPVWFSTLHTGEPEGDPFQSIAVPTHRNWAYLYWSRHNSHDEPQKAVPDRPSCGNGLHLVNASPN